ncbi:MAG: RDD family protein [Sphingobacteriales bacterium]|nr:RDD family protein [Sphingobacteriales bacterium]
MLIFGTKTIPTTIKTGEFQCPNCQDKRSYTLKRFKKYFHIFFIPLIPTDNLGDSLDCNYCSTSYIPGTILSKGEYSPENPLGNNFTGNYLEMIPTTFGTRLGAYIIDLILIQVITIALASMKLGIFLSLFNFIYFLACDIMFEGSSVGKLILKIKVSELDEDKLPTIMNLFIRNLIKGICGFFPLIYLFALSNKNVQTLHDKAAKTIVIGQA